MPYMPTGCRHVVSLEDSGRDKPYVRKEGEIDKLHFVFLKKSSNYLYLQSIALQQWNGKIILKLEHQIIL